jgi:hypothetical protein
MHQKLAYPAGIPVKDVSVVVRGYVHLIDQKLAVLDTAPGILQVQRTCPNGLYLSAAQLNAGLKFFFYEIFVPGFPVCGYYLDALLFQSAHLLVQQELYHDCQVNQTGISPDFPSNQR